MFANLTPEQARSISKPFLSGFNPFVIPYQGRVMKLLRGGGFDYSTGTPEILLSGSYGSAKSILMAHLAVTHCINNPKGRVCLARKAMPDLKDTIFKEILEHLGNYDEETQEGPDLIEGVDYFVNYSRASIKFKDGAEIISRSWADKKYKKGRSLKLSMLIFEELTENDEDDMQAFKTLCARVRRIPEVKENIIICATNPDGPSHWVYKYFMVEASPTKFVFYSVTTDNPFLDPIYIEQNMRNMTVKEADRYIRGMWVEIDLERVYYEYQAERNYRRDVDYTVVMNEPVGIMFDFNIGVGKPMSAAVGQYIEPSFHFFQEYIIEGARTLSILEEMANRGLFELPVKFMIYGDATGKARTTNALHSNYEIIETFLANFEKKDGGKITFEMCVGVSNPPIKTRHNQVNSYCFNALKETRFFVYKGCAKIDEGMRLTALKKGADYIEDDSKDYQHVTTAIGYYIVKLIKDLDYIQSIKKAGIR